MMQPSFEIDSTGKVLCKSHTYYDILKEVPLKYDFLGHLHREKALNCLKCNHYRNDDCFFPKTEIDKIQKDMGILRKIIRCEICGGRILQIFNVLYKFQAKELLNIHFGLVCCDCYRTLKDKNHNSVESKGIILVSLFFLIFQSISMGLWFSSILLLPLFFSTLSLFIMFSLEFALLYFIAKNIIKIVKRNKFKQGMKL